MCRRTGSSSGYWAGMCHGISRRKLYTVLKRIANRVSAEQTPPTPPEPSPVSPPSSSSLPPPIVSDAEYNVVDDTGDDMEMVAHGEYMASMHNPPRERCKWFERFAKRSCIIPLASMTHVRHITLSLDSCASLLAAYQTSALYDGRFGEKIGSNDYHLGLRRLLKVGFVSCPTFTLFTQSLHHSLHLKLQLSRHLHPGRCFLPGKLCCIEHSHGWRALRCDVRQAQRQNCAS